MADLPPTLADSDPLQGTRRRILDAAARIFRERGYSLTTMNDIADALGLKAASIYYHFKSKDEIVEEVLNQGTLSVSEAVRQAVDDLPAGTAYHEKLATAIRTHLSVLHSRGDYTAANIRLFPEAPRAVIKRHMAIRQSYGTFWVSLLVEGKETGQVPQDLNVDVSHMLLLGALNWSTQWYNPKLHSLEVIANSAISMLLNGLIPAGNEPGAARR